MAPAPVGGGVIRALGASIALRPVVSLVATGNTGFTAAVSVSSESLLTPLTKILFNERASALCDGSEGRCSYETQITYMMIVPVKCVLRWRYH